MASSNGDSRLWAFIGYLGILCLLPLLLKRDDAFAQYHAKQGLVLFITGVILSIIGIIPFIGWAIGFFGIIFIVVLWIIGIINALSGKEKPLPILGSFAQKFSI